MSDRYPVILTDQLQEAAITNWEWWQNMYVALSDSVILDVFSSLKEPGKYTYLLSCRVLDESIDTTLI